MTLSNRDKKTLRAVFTHPLPRNLKWKDLVALCEAAGVKVRKAGNGATFVFAGRSVGCHEPHSGGVDKGAVAAVRDLLKDGGVTPKENGS